MPAWLLALAGCSAPPSASGLDALLELEPAGGIPTMQAAYWTVPQGGTTWLEYGLDGALDQSSPQRAVESGPAEGTLRGLKSGRDYAVRAVLLTADGQRLESAVQTLEVPVRPAELGGIDVVVDERDAQQPGGFVLFTLMQADRSWVAMVDRDGDFVWWHDAGVGAIVPTVELSLSGEAVLYSTYDVQQVDDIATAYRIDLLTGEEQRTRTVLAHHDFAELPDGGLAWLAFRTEERMVEGQRQPVTGDVILVAPESGLQEDAAERDASEEIFDLHRLLRPSLPCEHAADVLAGTDGLDWSHGNSLHYEAADDSYLLMLRHLDTVLKIDGRTGEVRWSLGDVPVAPLAGPDHPLDHAHFSDAWPGGLLAFDNSDHRPEAVSRLVHLAIDEESGTYEEAWSYTDPDGAQVPVLGDARRLPDGSVLSSWASLGSIREIAQGAVVWRADLDLGGAVGRVRWIADLYDPGPEVEDGETWTAR